MQVVCGLDCAILMAKHEAQKKHHAKTRKMREAMNDKDRRHWIKKTQAAFNAYIRERDKNEPCISCGRFHKGQYHAGHYRPAGNNSALRFDERNCHRQCAPCNSHLSGNLIAYRQSLIRKLGQDVVDYLDNHHETKRWSIAELKSIHAEYKIKSKLLKSSSSC